MGTGNDTQKNQTNHPAQPRTAQKMGKGSNRYEDETAGNAQHDKSNPPQSHRGNDRQPITEKMDGTGPAHVGTSPQQQKSKD